MEEDDPYVGREQTLVKHFISPEVPEPVRTNRPVELELHQLRRLLFRSVERPHG